MPEIDVREPSVTIDGSPLDSGLLLVLEQIVVDDHVLLPAMFSIRFRDSDQDVLDNESFGIGKSVTIAVRTDSDTTTLLEGEITALEAEFDPTGSHAVVRGYDKAHRLHRGRKTRSFADMSDSDVVTQILGEVGLSAGSVSSTTVTHTHLVQANQTDWDFLTGRARDIGYELVLVDGSVDFREPTDGTSSADVTLDLAVDLFSFRPRITAVDQVDSVEVRGWDPESQEAVVATADVETVTAAVGIESSGIASDFGDRTYVTSRPFTTEDEAQALADALAERIGSAFAEAEGVADGNPSIRAGKTIEVSGVGTNFAGTYAITSSRHVFDYEGYRTHFTVSGRQERSLLGLASAGATNGGGVPAGNAPACTVGVVTDVKDPDNQGRVKVKLPWLADEYSTDWARVAYAGAGTDRGLVLMPEVDDEVLLCFAHGDWRRPYVIGSLFSANALPKDGSELVNSGSGAVDVRALVSRKGHMLKLDDAEAGGKILIQTGGSQNDEIEMDAASHKIRITANGDIEIEAKSPGKVTITAGTDLELKGTTSLKLSAPSIEIKADGTVDISGNGSVGVKSSGALSLEGTQLKASGTAQASFESAGILQVQGSLVKIN